MTLKQEMFVREYLVDLNATQAAIRAGYSEKTARQIGERLLSNVDIASAVNGEIAKRAERTQISADLVLARLNRIAAAAEDEREYSAAIKANELLGKHLKLFTDKTEISGAMNLTVVTGVPSPE